MPEAPAKTFRYCMVDAFAHGPYTGNPAGVLTQADGLSDQQMQAIAREINASETSFITGTRSDSGKLNLRWFTPAREVGFCGHATMAAAHALLDARSGGLAASAGGTARDAGKGDAGNSPSPAAVLFESKAGPLALKFESLPSAQARGNESASAPAEIRNEPAASHAGSAGAIEWADRNGLLWLRMPEPGMRTDNTNPIQTARLLGITVEDFEPGMPIMRTRDDDLIVMLRSWNTLVEMKPNFSELAAWGDRHRIRGFCCATLHTLDKSINVHSRFFAPSCGINEDPVTGSVHGPLVTLLVAHELVPMANGMAALNCMQGQPGGRTGMLRAFVEKGDKGYRVSIGGRCYTVMRGELRVPPEG